MNDQPHTAPTIDPLPPAHVGIGTGDCGRPRANSCGWGLPANCGIHGVRYTPPARPLSAEPPAGPVYVDGTPVTPLPPISAPVAVDWQTDGGWRSNPIEAHRPAPTTVESAGYTSGVYQSAAAAHDAAAAGRPEVTYRPDTVATSHPDGAATWGQVLVWALHADHRAAPDASGVLWCSAGDGCNYPRWSRYDPRRPGDPDRAVSELFAWLAEHWGCTR